MTMTCKPCRVTYEGQRYQISRDGSVWLVAGPGYAEGAVHFAHPEPADLALAVRREAARQRRNRNARDRHEALTGLGLRRAPGGAFGGYE